VEEGKRIVETEGEVGKGCSYNKSNDLLRAWRPYPEGVALNGAKRHDLVDPSFLAADNLLFCRALSLGVTFLNAAGAHPDVCYAICGSQFARHLDFVIPLLASADSSLVSRYETSFASQV
jgi:hypothetical protein